MITDTEKIIAIVDNDCLFPSDAIVLLAGEGYDRYRKAVSLYKEFMAPKVVLSDFITDYNYGCVSPKDMMQQMIKDGIPESDVICEYKPLSTQEYAKK